MSFHKDTKDLIRQAISKEYENATAADKQQHKGRYYNTLNEGCAILKEEVDEATEYMAKGHCSIYAILQNSWLLIKKFYCSKQPLITDMQEIELRAVSAMMELAQVAAVCKKMIDTINRWDEEKEK